MRPVFLGLLCVHGLGSEESRGVWKWVKEFVCASVLSAGMVSGSTFLLMVPRLYPRLSECTFGGQGLASVLCCVGVNRAGHRAQPGMGATAAMSGFNVFARDTDTRQNQTKAHIRVLAVARPLSTPKSSVSGSPHSNLMS